MLSTDDRPAVGGITAGLMPRRDRRTRWLMLADAESVHTRRFATALASAGVDVHLAAYACTIPPPGIAFHDLGPRPHRRPAQVVRLIRRLRGLVRSLDADVLNPHYVSGYGLLAAAA